MFNAIITLLVVFIIVRVAWRVMYPRRGHLPLPEEMAACDNCGIVLPVRHGVVKNDRFFCCAEHAGTDV